MATLALRPAYTVRPRSGSKRDPHRKRARNVRRRSWPTLARAAAAIVLTLFAVSVPLIGDPSGRLFALDVPTAVVGALGSDGWQGRSFEFTPALLGPVITAQLLLWAEEEPILIMPELVVHAAPPAAEIPAPRG